MQSLAGPLMRCGLPETFRVVAAQFLTSVAVAAGAWLIGGRRAAVSALLGGLACAVPNGLFALNLARLQRRPRGADGSGADGGGPGGAGSHAAALLVGEFIKVALTIGLLVLIARAVRDVVWPALIVAIAAVLLMQAAALIRR